MTEARTLIKPYQPRRVPRIEYLDIRGLRHKLTCWDAVGGERQTNDEPILLLHGFQDCGTTYQFLVDCLPDDWAFIAPDLRGFGGSDCRNDSYWFPDYLADIDALLAQCLPTGAPGRMIGHSMGGNIALLHAGVRAERWRWVVSLEGFGLPRTQPTNAPGQYLKWLNSIQAGLRARSIYADADALAHKLLERNVLLDPARAAFIARAWTRPLADGRVELATDPWHRLVNPVLYRREEAEACWERIIAPTLMVLASGSEYLSRIERDDDLLSMQKCIRNLEVARLEGLGHMMHHEDPAAVADSICRFVSAQK